MFARTRNTSALQGYWLTVDISGALRLSKDTYAALAEVEASIKVQALREAADWLDHEDRAAGILEPDVAGLDAYRLRERADRIEAGESE